MNPSWFRRVGLLSVGALATTGPVLLADHTAIEAGGSAAQQALAASGWRDVLDGYRAPLLPDPSRDESAIVVLQSDPLARRPSADRARAADDIRAEQRTLEASLTGLGATVNVRYQNVVNGLAIRIPSGRLPLVAALPGVRSVHPVTYMAPAAETQEVQGKPLPGAATAPQTAAAGAGTATIALIDAGIHSAHPWLGGGIGNTRLIVGGADFVQGNADPEALPQTRVLEAHGTEMASVVLNSDAVRDLPIDRYPRMFAYRVMAAEQVNGRTRMLARSDRVIAAMDRAVDPNHDGDLTDHASVILLGVSRGRPTAGDEPVREAADNADRIGSVVVAPAGNDGPSGDAATGTVAGPAASESVLTVGAAGAATTPRTGALALSVGPASARLAGLPLMGPAPSADGLPVVVLSGSDGVGTGSTIAEYVDGRGQSRVRGALVVVARGGEATIPEKARLAAQAGARAMAVWDQSGDGRFPGIAADTVIPIPVVGLGGTQGRALLDHRDLTVTMSADAVTGTDQRVASFSSRGPTAEGRSEPDVVAPGVDVTAAYPGEGPEPLTARVSGTSPAAAEVAAAALRLRIDDPGLTPEQVRSLIVQSARSLPGEPADAQGAGLLGTPRARPVAIEPSIVSLRRARHAPAGTVAFAVSSMTGTPLDLRAAIVRDGGTVVAPGEVTPLPAHGRATMNVTIPAGFPPSDSTLVLIDAGGKVVATAPFVIVPPETSAMRLAVPTVNARSRTAQVTIGITGGGTARSLQVWLVPASGTPVLMSSDRVEGEWPSGAYRFSMTRRSASGEQVAAGRYRVRVRAVAPDGRRLTQQSGPFVLK